MPIRVKDRDHLKDLLEKDCAIAYKTTSAVAILMQTPNGRWGFKYHPLRQYLQPYTLKHTFIRSTKSSSALQAWDSTGDRELYASKTAEPFLKGTVRSDSDELYSATDHAMMVIVNDNVYHKVAIRMVETVGHDSAELARSLKGHFYSKIKNCIPEYSGGVGSVRWRELARQLTKYFRENVGTSTEVDERRAESNPLTNPEEGCCMDHKDAPLVQTVTYIKGTSVGSLSADQLVETIRELEARVSSLKEIKAESKGVQVMIEKTLDDLNAVTKILDEKIAS